MSGWGVVLRSAGRVQRYRASCNWCFLQAIANGPGSTSELSESISLLIKSLRGINGRRNDYTMFPLTCVCSRARAIEDQIMTKLVHSVEDWKKQTSHLEKEFLKGFGLLSFSSLETEFARKELKSANLYVQASEKRARKNKEGSRDQLVKSIQASHHFRHSSISLRSCFFSFPPRHDSHIFSYFQGSRACRQFPGAHRAPAHASAADG